MPRLGCIEIATLCLQRDLGEIFRPIDIEGAALIEIAAGDLGRAPVIAPEPAEFDQIWRELLFRDERLDAQEEQGTVRFHDDAHTTLGRSGEKLHQCRLSTRVEM